MRSELDPVVVAVLTSDPLVRAALEQSVRGEPGLALAEQPTQADVLLWDPGLEPTTERYRELPASSLPIAVLAADPGRAAGVLSAGAKAVLARDIDPAALAAALRAIERGLTVLDPPARAQLLPGTPSAATDPHEELTAREVEVLALLASGLSNKAIARRLQISEHTAKFHVSSVLDKLGASSRTEAVVEAARRSLLTL